MSDDHELISWLKDYAGDQQTDEAMQQRFLRLSDGERVRDLQNLSSWLADDSNLRRKSQLMKLGQDLGRLHNAMRRADR